MVNMKNKVNRSASLEVEAPCNCRIPTTCPLDKLCNVKAVIYEAEVEPTSPGATVGKKKYIGMTEGAFKYLFQ